MNTFRTTISQLLILCLVLFASGQLTAQTLPTVTPTVTSNGFSLKKQVSNSTVPSGVVFTYTIFYTVPAGASSVVITDQAPTSLVIDSVVPGSGCGTPTVTVTGNTVSYALSGVAAGCSGTFQINVHFPAGTTCPGVTARNRACLQAQPQTDICTEYISTQATADNPFKVSKGVTGLSWNPQNNGCQYIMAEGANVTYNLMVYKASPYQGNDDGQINLNNAVVTDVLPAGATLVSSTCGVTQTGNTLTWNVGNLNAATPWVWQSCQVTVNYPAGTFPVGTQIPNTATLSGLNACNQQYSTNSNTTCVEVVAPTSSGTFGKSVYLNNKMPGCTGVYYLTTCNNGNTPLTFSVSDVLPAGITVNSIQFYASAPVTATATLANSSVVSIASGSTGFINWTAPTVSPVASVQISQSGLAAGSCLQVQLKFTIDASVAPNTTITNCATLTSTQISTQQKCVSFVTASPAPDLCLYKQICNAQTGYQPGDIFRYRLRIQNIGSQNANGFNITDVLDPNLTYIGNQVAYYGNSYNTACGGPGATPWSVSAPSVSGNTLTWSGVNIAAECQDFYYVNCGVYGTQGVTFYFIEFDVQVAADAASGIVPNTFGANGGNLTGPETSNTVNTVINVTHGTELTKELSADNSTWGGSATTTPGGNLWYRLNFKNTGSGAIYDVRKVDLLALNDGGNDWLVMNRAVPRGSQFGVSNPVSYAYNTISTPATTGTANTMAGNNLSLFNALGASIGTTPDAWPYAGSGNNVGIGYGPAYGLSSGGTLQASFQVTASPNAQVQQRVCNDFAANGSGKYIINGALTFTPLTAAASNVVCASVEQGADCCEGVKVNYSQEEKCCLEISTECPVKQLQVFAQGGVISNAGWNCAAPLGAYQGQSNYSFAPGGCAPLMKLCFETLPGNSSGIITVNLLFTFTNGEKCERSIQLEGCPRPEPSDCCGDWDLTFKHSFFKKTGIFEYNNPSTKPICSVSIQANPGLTAGSYSADSGPAQPMTSTSLITLAPPALNSIKFWMSSNFWYSSPIVLQVNYCDGTYCLDTLRWKGHVIDHDVDILRENIPGKLYAVQLQVDPNIRYAEEVAAISVSLELTDVRGDFSPYIFAATAGKIEGEALSGEQACAVNTWMSADNVYAAFPTKEDGEFCGSARQKRLALVIGDHPESQSPPVLLVTYFDREGNVIATSELMNYTGGQVTTATEEIAAARTDIAQVNVYPNPADDHATFTYTIARARNLRIELYDARGQRLETLEEEEKSAGFHQLELSTGHLPPGVYIIRLQSEGAVQSLRLSVVR